MCVDPDERALDARRSHIEPELGERGGELLGILEVARGLPDVEVAIEHEAAVGLADVLGEVRAHQRQAEDRDVERLVLKRNVGDVAGDHALVDRDVVEAVDGVLAAGLGRDESFTAAEIAHDAPLAL